jgi:small subunit ribosomal protein S17
MAVKERVGLVVSDKMMKTVVVAVENRTAHPKYGKIVVRTKRYKAHDEENQCKEGDRVRNSRNPTLKSYQTLDGC